jgi:hypothetical protein
VEKVKKKELRLGEDLVTGFTRCAVAYNICFIDRGHSEKL